MASAFNTPTRPRLVKSCPLATICVPTSRSTSPACTLANKAAALPFSRVLSASIRATRARSAEHTSELQSLMRISYAVFCLKKKTLILYSNTCNSRTDLDIHHSLHQLRHYVADLSIN